MKAEMWDRRAIGINNYIVAVLQNLEQIEEVKETLLEDQPEENYSNRFESS